VQSSMKQIHLLVLALAAPGSWTLVACSRTKETKDNPPRSWDPKAAAAYRDQREVTRMQRLGAAHDHDTSCISCHTALP
jgi:squalene-hopene/tetraprenyl-beta-curcumene cyclase